MEELTHILIPIAGCAMIFGIVYVAVTANNRENMAMIEAGMNPKAHKATRHSRLRIALLAFMVPIGILTGNLTHGIFSMDPEPAAVVFSFLFGGLALTATYFIEDARQRNSSEEE
jgi:hypothetical protein